jgi:nucleoside-diphosphate-sugar epimerase
MSNTAQNTVQTVKDLAATATSSITNLANGSKIPQNQTILITGASGFLATHVLNSFLSRGYNVRGTVRSDASADKVKRSHAKYHSQLSFAIVKDVAAPGAFDEAVKGVDGVIHTASPFQMSVENNERDLLDPAVNGTTGILAAIKKNNPNVKRVVITSSFASIFDASQGNRPGYTYTEADWNPVTWDAAKTGGGGIAYMASKTFAEKAAFDFVKDESPNFSISTICPPMIYGPLDHGVSDMGKLNTSAADMYRLINGSEKSVPDTTFFAYVDVRDVAEAHLRAYETPAAGGERYIITAGSYTYLQVCDIIRENVPEVKAKTPVGTPGAPLPDVYKVSNEKARKELGMSYRSMKETVVDTVRSLYDLEQGLKK